MYFITILEIYLTLNLSIVLLMALKKCKYNFLKTYNGKLSSSQNQF